MLSLLIPRCMQEIQRIALQAPERFFVEEESSASARILARVETCTGDAGFIETRRPVPGTGNQNLRYKASIGRGAGGEATSLAISLCNPNPDPIPLVVCSMANREGPRAVPDRYLINREFGTWTCSSVA